MHFPIGISVSKFRLSAGRAGGLFFFFSIQSNQNGGFKWSDQITEWRADQITSPLKPISSGYLALGEPDWRFQNHPPLDRLGRANSSHHQLSSIFPPKHIPYPTLVLYTR